MIDKLGQEVSWFASKFLPAELLRLETLHPSSSLFEFREHVFQSYLTLDEHMQKSTTAKRQMHDFIVKQTTTIGGRRNSFADLPPPPVNTENLPLAGCTAVIAVIRDDTLIVANAGDSRCIICQAGRAVAISKDHKPDQAEERKRIDPLPGGFVTGGRIRLSDGSMAINVSRALGKDYYYIIPFLMYIYLLF